MTSNTKALEEFRKSMEEYKKAWNKNKKLGKGLRIGKIIRIQVADGYAIYEITGIGKSISKVKYREDLNLDGYYANCVDEKGNILTSNLKSIVDWDDNINTIFKAEEE